MDYDGETPLGLNPFDLEGCSLDNNKIEVLSGIVQRFWRRMFGKDEEAVRISPHKIHPGLLRHLPATPIPFPLSTATVTGIMRIFAGGRTWRPQYFDLSSFRPVCSEFTR